MAEDKRTLLTVLGATGSIGMSTLDVVGRHPERFQVFALTGRRQMDRLAQQCAAFRPRFAVVMDEDSARTLRGLLDACGCRTEVLVGEQAAVFVASAAEVDAVMAAIVGAAGLLPTLAAVRAGKRVLLANKEALVMAGDLFMREVEAGGATLLPIDSEHNAVFQSLPAGFKRGLDGAGVRRIVLTASGGPFRTVPLTQLAEVTPDEACAHPNWVMGRKISVDSATMMNKGLEVIEAHWLFGASPERIDVLIHPQSVIHSMVEYADGSVIAQLGNPDMRTPIAHALAHPRRIEAGVGALDLAAIGSLSFEAPDLARFPCLALAYRALRDGGTAPTLLNAANEVAVDAFLGRELAFPHIADVIAEVLDTLPALPAGTLEAVVESDRQARETARSAVRRRRMAA